ncbi:MFS general substrate transporter [Coniophora puteana RWD-64-598 SS2]|uniref:MFS general substrate transporter n=1 Tax=Coniophora puteana (strain RWD-64-598) TaxID=741705 RepID=A0A5M3MBD2_CONPW|nr:MFS general substrate transporter [Coniophora puteana RWD-64-598 SS2]EIW75945.1 MFS general substrate transporter [Coniophora puteana RWD-64-598 SS2]
MPRCGTPDHRPVQSSPSSRSQGMMVALSGVYKFTLSPQAPPAITSCLVLRHPVCPYLLVSIWAIARSPLRTMLLTEKQEVEAVEEVISRPPPLPRTRNRGSPSGFEFGDYGESQRIPGLGDAKALEKKLVRKLDARMAILVLIYILNYIDRTNISSARLQGFEQDLHLEGQQYSVVLSILFVGYIIMQIPCNMFIEWIERPSVFLSLCTVLWGVISALTGICTNFAGALAVRFFLGFVEAAFYPGALFLLSRWYTPSELGARVAVLCCGSYIGNGWGALLASGILARMGGVLGHAAWRWLFFLEGGITVLFALCACVLLPDFPHNTRWLSPAERALAIERMERAGVSDRDDSSPDPSEKRTSTIPQGRHSTRASERAREVLHGLRLALSDWTAWWFAVAAFFQFLAQSFFIFFPTLAATLGFGTTATLALCAPPWMFASGLAIVLALHSDRTKRRFEYIVFSELAGIVGFIIAMSTMNTAARYISLFLMAQVYAGLVVFNTWTCNAFPRPPAKRAVVLALVNGVSQLGNVVGPYVIL